MWAGSAKGARAAVAAPPSSPSTAKAFQEQQLHTHGQHRGSSAPSPPHRMPEPVAPIWPLRLHGSTRATVNSRQRWDMWLQTHSGSGKINGEVHNLSTARLHYLSRGASLLLTSILLSSVSSAASCHPQISALLVLALPSVRVWWRWSSAIVTEIERERGWGEEDGLG